MKICLVLNTKKKQGFCGKLTHQLDEKKPRPLSPTADPLAAFFYSQPPFFRIHVWVLHLVIAQPVFKPSMRDFGLLQPPPLKPAYPCVKVHYHQFFFLIPLYIPESYTAFPQHSKTSRLFVALPGILSPIPLLEASAASDTVRHTQKQSDSQTAGEVNLVVQRQG
jgi:hypothetical protein